MSGLVMRAADLPRDMQTLTRLCWDYRAALLALGPEVEAVIDRFYPADSYDALIVSLPEKHARPKGTILIAELDGTAIGCAMIQPLNDDDAEIKRVFVDPAAQGNRTGEALSKALIAQAKEDGYRRILLDTTRASHPARRLYEKLGFVPRGPYAEIPDDVVDLFVFFEMNL
ncbi:MAG: GNAT family N-acetyltransferase [Roseobacter sp.]